jgi:hypothetical protein
MINKNYIFILSSILIGFIVSYFYVKIINNNFYILFLCISITTYIFFYFLGNDTIEKFELLIKDDKKELFKNITQEEHMSEEDNEINHPLPYHQILSEKNKLIQEEEHKNNNLPVEKNNINKNINLPLHETNKITNIVENDISKLTYPVERPININISYNNENKTVTSEQDINENNNENNKKNVKITKNDNQRIHLNNTHDSRIKLNSDWIYGESAWTNEPDFYVPAKNDVKNISQTLNEKINLNNFKQSTRVSPLMINVPWTEYKSGDSEPDPYNLK